MINFIFLGLIASIFQLVVLRELTFSIAKNELSFVVAVGLWLVFCSLGSLAGKRKLFLDRRSLGPGFCLVFCLSITAIHLIKSFFGLSYYELPSFVFVLITTFFLVGPLSFLTGYGFSLFSKEYLAEKPCSQKTSAKFFIFEAIGFFIGGAGFAFFLAGYSNPFIFSFLPVLFLLRLKLPSGIKIFLLLIVVSLSLCFHISFQALLNKEFKGAELLRVQGSGYGPVILAENYGVESLYANGSLVATSEDKPSIEEFIHTSICSVSDPKNILFIGPYFSGQIDEILKHKPQSVDLLDINPVISAWAKEKAPDPKNIQLNFITTDPRLYLRNTAKKYDCVIMNMAAPSSFSFNRYFSYQFFELIKKHLKDEGVFSFFIPSKRDILSPNFVKFNSCIINTVDKVFANRLLIPSDSMLILASRAEILPQSIINNFKRVSPKTDYFTFYHLSDSLDFGRRLYSQSMLDKNIGLNSDFYPLGFLYYSLLQEAKFYPGLVVKVRLMSYFIAGLFILGALVSYFFRFLNLRSSFLSAAATVGFVAIGFSAINFILFQVYSGALLWKAGILTGLFMLALSLGAYLINLISQVRVLKSNFLFGYYCLWLMFLVSFFVAFQLLERIAYPDLVFYFYSFFCGLLTGAVYPLLSKRLAKTGAKPENIAASIYAADLAGAFLGTFLLSAFLIPFLGINLSLAGLILVIAVAILRR